MSDSDPAEVLAKIIVQAVEPPPGASPEAVNAAGLLVARDYLAALSDAGLEVTEAGTTARMEEVRVLLTPPMTVADLVVARAVLASLDAKVQREADQ